MPDAMGFEHAIGVITPSGNLVVERVVTAVLRELPTVSAHFSRIPVAGSRDPFPDGYDIASMLTAARLLADAKPASIQWNGSKGGAIGFAHDRDLKARIEDATGIPATTSSLALVEALERLGAERVALVTPYADAYQQKLVMRLAGEGIACVSESHLGLTDNLSYASVAPARIVAQARDAVLATRPDAVLTWCTNYAAALVAAEIEAELDLPVLDATLLPVWGACRMMGVNGYPASCRWGRLFAL